MKKYDPTLFEGTAEYYAQYRAGYSDELFNHLISQFNLNKHSKVLDLGCGTGQIAFKLSPHVKSIVCIDPGAGMLEEVRRIATERDIQNIECIQQQAEDISKTLGIFDLVTIGSAFHWMDRPLVLDRVYDATTLNGGVAIIGSGGVPVWAGNQKHSWEAERKVIVQKYFGEKRRAGVGQFESGDDKFEDRLLQSRFERFSTFQCQQTIERDIESILGLLYSTSFDRKDFLKGGVIDFEKEMRAAFAKHFPNGVCSEEQTIEALLAWK